MQEIVTSAFRNSRYPNIRKISSNSDSCLNEKHFTQESFVSTVAVSEKRKQKEGKENATIHKFLV